MAPNTWLWVGRQLSNCTALARTSGTSQWSASSSSTPYMLGCCSRSASIRRDDAHTSALQTMNRTHGREQHEAHLWAKCASGCNLATNSITDYLQDTRHRNTRGKSLGRMCKCLHVYHVHINWVVQHITTKCLTSDNHRCLD